MNLKIAITLLKHDVLTVDEFEKLFSAEQNSSTQGRNALESHKQTNVENVPEKQTSVENSPEKQAKVDNNALMNGIKDIISSQLAQFNISNSKAPKPDSVDDIIANIINPKEEK